MSVCISRHGEFGSHELNPDHICTLCAWLDEDGLINELHQLREERDRFRGHSEMLNAVGYKVAHELIGGEPAETYARNVLADVERLLEERRDLREERDALRVGVQAIADKLHRTAIVAGGHSAMAALAVEGDLRSLLDRTSITGE